MRDGPYVLVLTTRLCEGWGVLRILQLYHCVCVLLQGCLELVSLSSLSLERVVSCLSHILLSPAFVLSCSYCQRSFLSLILQWKCLSAILSISVPGLSRRGYRERVADALKLHLSGLYWYKPILQYQKGTGMVICLERGANDLHMVHLMPLPPHHLLLQ